MQFALSLFFQMVYALHQYIKIVCDILEILPPETIIHRLAGNGLVKDLVAPKWLPKKFEILNKNLHFFFDKWNKMLYNIVDCIQTRNRFI